MAKHLMPRRVAINLSAALYLALALVLVPSAAQANWLSKVMDAAETAGARTGASSTGRARPSRPARRRR